MTVWPIWSFKCIDLCIERPPELEVSTRELARDAVLDVLTPVGTLLPNLGMAA